MSHSNLVDFWRQDDLAWRDHRSTGSYRALQNANVPSRMGPLLPPFLRFSQRTCRHTTVPSRSWINPTAVCTRPLSKRASSITHVRIHVQSSQCQQLFAKCLLLQRIVVVGSGGGVDGNHDQKLARYVRAPPVPFQMTRVAESTVPIAVTVRVPSAVDCSGSMISVALDDEVDPCD